MAYRRSITTRAKLLYEQQRFAPSFSFIHSDDENNSRIRSPDYPSSSSNHPIFNQSRAFGSIHGQNSYFLGRRFTSPVPMGFGSFLSRNMSTSVGESADKVGLLKDVVSPDVFLDGTIEAVTTQAAPVANEVAMAAADSFLPVAGLQYLIEYVHTLSGLNWWASIAITTLLIRSATIPFLINQLKATTKFTLLRPHLEEVKEEMQNRGMSPSAVAEGQAKMQALFKEYKVTPFTPLKGLLIQGPVFLCFFLAIQNMADKVPSFTQGGAYWFVDLTTPDAMYIFPVLTALSFWITVECNMQEGMEGNPAAKTIKNVSRVFAALTVPLTASFPKAIFCYWITSNIFSLMYGMVIKKPEVKKFLGIPIIPTTPAPAPSSTEQKPGFSFFEAIKKYAEAQAKAQVRAQTQTQTQTQQPSLPSASPSKESKNVNQKIPSSSVLSQRLRSLEKEVKGRKKGKKR